jgi:hypothetical protein
MDRLSFLYFEALLSYNEKDVKKLEDFMLKKQDLLNGDDMELFNYLQIIRHNYNLYEEITKTLTLYTATFLNSTARENQTFIELVKLSKNFFPALDGPATISSLLGSWFVHALNSNSNEVLVFTEENLVWKPRYEIIFQVKALLWRFILQVEITTGVHIRVDENVKTLIWVLLQTLINHGTLSSRTRFVAKNKSEVFVGGLSVSNFLSSQLDLKLLTSPSHTIYLHKAFYFYTKHYSNLQTVFRTGMTSHKTPKFASMCFLEKLIGMKLFINDRLLNKIILAAEKHYQVDLTQSDSLVKKLQKLKRESVWNNLSQKQYQRYYRLQYLVALKQSSKYYAQGAYFKYYFDFRGRVYADSPVSYTFNKTTRFLYYYGVYTAEELLNFENTCSDFYEYTFKLILPGTDLVEKYPTISFNKKVVQYYLYTIFFELGKLQKTKLSVFYEGRVTINDFIKAGIDYYNNPPSCAFDFDEQVEYLAILDILDSLAEQKYCKIPIYKDATASALQLLVLLLGPANKQIWNEANFGSTDFWYDTYYGIIASFWKQHNIPDDVKKQYFTRGALKKTIMTHNYQATYLTCLNEFKAQHKLPWDNNDERNAQIIPIFKAFYNYLNFLFNSKSYFAVSSHVLLNWFQIQWEREKSVYFTTHDNLWIPLEYVKLIKRRVERQILAKRETITWLSKSQEIDETKMFRAIQANIIHSFDGYLVRSVTTKLGYPIITIHDSFGIDILHIPQLIKITQAELDLLSSLNIFSFNMESKEPLLVRSPFVLL